MSQSYDVALTRGDQSNFEITPADDVLAELVIDRAFALVQFSDRARLLTMDDDGFQLRRLDAAEWTLHLAQPTADLLVDAADGLIWPWDAGIDNLPRGGYDKFDLRPFIARSTPRDCEGACDEWTAMPRGDAVDLDGDGADDIVLAARHQAWIMAVSGRSGSPLWFVRRGDARQSGVDDSDGREIPSMGVRSAVLYPPQWIADIDDDHRPDLLAVIGDVSTKQESRLARRWVEAFSGATGESRWRYDLTDELFASSPQTVSPYAPRWFVGGVESYGSGGGFGMSNWQGRVKRWSQVGVARRGTFVTMPTDLHISADGRPDGQTVSLLAGDQIVCLDGAARRACHRPAKSEYSRRSACGLARPGRRRRGRSRARRKAAGHTQSSDASHE